LGHHVKAYIDTYYSVQIASALPSDNRRDALEALVWKALQDAQEFMKTEEAAKSAQARLRVMEVVAALSAVHLEIMKYQDQAAVAPLLQRVEVSLRELDKIAGKSSRQT